MCFARAWALLFLVVIVPAQADKIVPAQADKPTVYKWVDAKGVTHYSDTKPQSGARHQQLVLPQPNVLTSETLNDFPSELATTSSPVPKRKAVLLDSRSGGNPYSEHEHTTAEFDGYIRSVVQPPYCVARGTCLKPNYAGFRPPRRHPVHSPPARKPGGEAKQKKIHIRGKGFDVSRNQRVCLGNCNPLRCRYDDRC